MVETPNLTELVRTLELRWRVRIFVEHLATTFAISAAASLAVALVEVLFVESLSLGRILLIVNGAAIVMALILSALRRRTPQLLLSDADGVYQFMWLPPGTHSLRVKARGFREQTFELRVSANPTKQIIRLVPIE